MVSPQIGCHGSGMSGFIVLCRIKPHGKGSDGPSGDCLHECRNTRRVEPATQKCTDRDIGIHAKLNGIRY
jgi:hypothetical protein